LCYSFLESNQIVFEPEELFMLRFASLSIVCLAALSSAEAGQIVTIGSNITFNAGTGEYQSANGINSSYVAGGTGVNACAGAQLYGNACAAAVTPVGFAERNYSVTLYQAALNGTSVPSPFSGYSASLTTVPNQTITPANTSAGQTLTDPTNHVTFSMLSDTASATTNNFWDSNTTGADSIVIPIGIQGVDQVWTMINDLYGLSGNSYITVQFNFSATSSSVANPALALSVGLQEGKAVGSSVACSAAVGSAGGHVCTDFGIATLGTAVPFAGGSVTTTQTTSTMPYTTTATGGSTVANGAYAGTSGSLFLDDQSFSFGTAYLADYLVSITVSDSSGAADISRAALSAIAIDTVVPPAATPEPSTILLGLTGLVALGFFKLRRTADKSLT
jgi:hypothetical protein